MIVELLLYAIAAPLTQHHYDMTVFYYATLILLHGLNPYNVPLDAPWIYSNPLAYPQWYAYPPLGLLIMASASLPFYLAHVLNITVFRIILKLILIISVFHIAYRLSHDKRELRKILLNPLLFFVAAVHGMIDPIAASFVTESLYRLKRGDKLWWPFFAFALVTKQTTWIVAPALAGYAIKQGRVKELFMAAILAVIIVAPFYGNGFIENVLMIHEDRPPASLGYAALPLIFVAGDSATFHIASILGPCYGKAIPTPSWGAIVLGAMLILSMVYSFILALRGKLFSSAIVASLAFMLFSKVVSPQNLLVPLVVILMVTRPNKLITLFSLLAAIVDATMGTAYSVFGYLAEDVLNALGTSIVHVYRELLWMRKFFDAVALVSLVTYHILLMTIIFLIVRRRLKRKYVFFIAYAIYLVLVINSIKVSHESVRGFYVSSNSKIAVVWLWLNPLNGMRAGDYAFLHNVTAYWEYTYPLALQTVKWLKDHGFGAVGLVYSVDRDSLYEYVPWLFALVKEHMPYVWVVVVPKNYTEYVYGYASAPPNVDLDALLKMVYKRTPVYVNNKVEELKRIIKNNKISSMISTCPIGYLKKQGKAVIYLIGSNEEVRTRDYVALPLPKNAVIINDFYHGKVLWGTPITPRKPVTLWDYLR